jgi:hypothetical protein
VTGDEAGELVLADLRPRVAHLYEPVITLIEDVGEWWRVFYNNRAHVETGEPGTALAGNWPKLVHKGTGAITPDEAYRREALGLVDE